MRLILFDCTFFQKILDAPIYKEYRFQTDSSQPKFHKLKIDVSIP
jgi:hypothetical protein